MKTITAITMPAPAPVQLSKLVKKINGYHSKSISAVRASLKNARLAGELLFQAKNTVGHGHWLAWLRQNFDGSERLAQQYMRIHERWDELTANPQHVADLNVREAIELLTDGSAEAEDLEQDAPSDDGLTVPCTCSDGGTCEGCVGVLAWLGEFEAASEPANVRTFRIGEKVLRAIYDDGPSFDIAGWEWEAFIDSVKDHGIVEPIILDEDDNVIDGIQRLRAAIQLGLPAEEVPIEVMAGFGWHEKANLWTECNLLRRRQSKEVLAAREKEWKERWAAQQANLGG